MDSCTSYYNENEMFYIKMCMYVWNSTRFKAIPKVFAFRNSQLTLIRQQIYIWHEIWICKVTKQSNEIRWIRSLNVARSMFIKTINIFSAIVVSLYANTLEQINHNKKNLNKYGTLNLRANVSFFFLLS